MPTALAVIAAVPKEEIKLKSRTLPNWNIPFSSPLGIPTKEIFLIMFHSKRWCRVLFRCSSSVVLKSRAMITTAEVIRAIRAATPTPLVPQFRPKTNRAPKAMLTVFISRDTLRVTLDLPMVRKIAAPPLYRAIKGIEAATITR